MSLLPLYKRVVRGSCYIDPDDELGSNLRYARALSAEPRYVQNALVPRALSMAREIIEEPVIAYEGRYTLSDTLGRLGDVLGRGDDAWLDRYKSNVRAPKTRVIRVSRVGREYPVRRRFLTSDYYPYRNALPGFYRYAKDHHWSLNNSSGLEYLHSTPALTSKTYDWDWSYPYRSYMRNFSPSYIHYPRSSHEYLYPRNI